MRREKLYYIRITFDTANPGFQKIAFFCPESYFTLQNIDLPLRTSSSNSSRSTMRCLMAAEVSERKPHCVGTLGYLVKSLMAHDFASEELHE